MSSRQSAKGKSQWTLQRWFRKGRIPLVILLALITVGIGATNWFNDRETVRRWEFQAHDTRFSQRGPLLPHPDIVVVGVTASSFDQELLKEHAAESEMIRTLYENPRWPWPRSIHARVIEKLLDAGAKVVAVDLVFAARTADDPALIEVLRKYPGRVVLAASTQEMADDNSGAHKVFQYPNSDLTTAAGESSVGFVTYSEEGDGVRRHFDYRTSEVRENPTLSRYMEDPRDLWKFAPLTVRKFTGRELPSDYWIPINYGGPVNTYPALPVENLFTPNVWETDRRYRGGEAFRGKIVFYGPIAEILHDTMMTPFGVMPGVEGHAHVAANLLRGDVLRDASIPARWAVAFIGALACAAGVLILRNAWLQMSVVIGLCVLFIVGTQWAFTSQNVLFPVVPTLFAILVTGALGTTYHFILEQWEKAQTRKVLDRSVNKRIAKVMMRNAEGFDQVRRGERRPVAILFSDIRNFTTWSEQAEPEHLVGQLNEYFERMVDLIERDDSLGNAQKFIGDAILAAWGDTPENQFGEAEDARRAVSVALKMRVALRELNSEWDARPDRKVISIGIGINLGEVVVGEVGHPERREYTVLGDGVNFAARLESATKQLHTDCLIGEKVEALTRDKFVFRHVDHVRVKGKTKPVNIYILLSDRSVAPPDWLADYHRARSLYVNRQFTEAAALFREVGGRIGEEDYLCSSYAERCDRYAQEPPSADWDRSYTLTEK